MAITGQPAIIQVIEENLLYGYRKLAQAFRPDWFEEKGITGFFSPSPLPLCNGVISTHAPEEDIETTIHHLMEQAQHRHCALTWLISPSSTPTNVPHRLERLGWVCTDTVIGMSRPLINLPPAEPSDLICLCVETREQMASWLSTFCAGFELPEHLRAVLFDLHERYDYHPSPTHRFFLGVLNGAPVATAMLLFDGKTAGVYAVSTLPEMRRQGGGRAMTHHTLLQARSTCTVAVLQATRMGKSIYEQLGFQQQCVFSTYVWQPEFVE